LRTVCLSRGEGGGEVGIGMRLRVASAGKSTGPAGGAARWGGSAPEEGGGGRGGVRVKGGSRGGGRVLCEGKCAVGV